MLDLAECVALNRGPWPSQTRRRYRRPECRTFRNIDTPTCQAAGCGPRRSARWTVWSATPPDRRCGGGERECAHRGAQRCGRTVGGRVLDGAGRVHVGHDGQRADRLRGPAGAACVRAVIPRPRRPNWSAMFVDMGMTAETAEKATEEIHRDEERALNFHLAQELGVDPSEKPSPWVAAGSVVRDVRDRRDRAAHSRTCWVSNRSGWA